jgi:hypothetical protein
MYRETAVGTNIGLSIAGYNVFKWDRYYTDLVTITYPLISGCWLQKSSPLLVSFKLTKVHDGIFLLLMVDYLVTMLVVILIHPQVFDVHTSLLLESFIYRLLDDLSTALGVSPSRFAFDSYQVRT